MSGIAPFMVPMSVHHVLRSALLSGDLYSKYNIQSMPVRKDDDVQVARGTYKVCQGKLIQVYCWKWVTHIERTTCEKVVFAKLRLEKDQKLLLDRKAKDQNLAITHQVRLFSLLFFQF
ncbi:hypothetical protein UlMin_033758 [Ulmus minor]